MDVIRHICPGCSRPMLVVNGRMICEHGSCTGTPAKTGSRVKNGAVYAEPLGDFSGASSRIPSVPPRVVA